MDALTVHRLHFAFTVTFHYIFPQLTMGLALLILILKTMALRTGDEHYHRAARFWAKIFAINFAMGVVTGIPMEFQFGTNWARFSKAAGGVIGQTLAMEGVFSFFLESSFLGVFLFGEKRLGPKAHRFAGLLAFRLLHYRDRRLDATPHRVPTGKERRDPAYQPCWAVLESVVILAVPPQHDRVGGHRQFRHGRGGGILPAHQAERGVRPHVCAARGDRRRDFHPSDGVPQRRRTGQEHRLASAPYPGRHGGPVCHRARSPARHCGTAGPREAPPGQSAHHPARAQLPDVSTLGRGSEGSQRVSGGTFAGQYSAALLQLSHHDRAWNDFDRGNGTGIAEPVARQALPRARPALAVDADAAFSVYRDYRGMDHRGSWPPTVAHLRHHAHH